MKILSILRWLGVMLASLFFWITAKFMFPIAYLLRDKPLFRDKILWVYWDDELLQSPLPKDFLSWLKDRDFTFINQYLWYAWRNSAYNQYKFLRPIQDLKVYVSSSGYHSKNGNYDISVFDMCTLKYVDELGNFDYGNGKYLSLKYSVIGNMFVWYKVRGRLYWRFSFAFNVNYLIGFVFELFRWLILAPIYIANVVYGFYVVFIKNDLYIKWFKYDFNPKKYYLEFQIGTNDRRYTWRLKLKRVSVFENK